MKKNYQPIMHCDYGQLNSKVDLFPDFLTGFEASKREKIVAAEARFFHDLMALYSVDEQLEKSWLSMQARDGTVLRIKAYRPKKCAETLSAVMFFHGGGFRTCSVETHDYPTSYLAAKAHVAVFSVEYRLAPEYKFPTGIEDCYDACAWVFRHSDELLIDPLRMAVAGDSSGGNFAAVIALMARERGDFSIWKQILIYAVTEQAGVVERTSRKLYVPFGGKAHGVSPTVIAYLTDPEKETLNPMVSPMLAHDFSNLPPALFIEAECDALVDDGLIYANLLQDAGVLVECHIYRGMPHAFLHRPYQETFQALDCICKFLKNYP